MELLDKYRPRRSLLLSGFLLATFISYPNINGIFFDMRGWIEQGVVIPQVFIWILRYLIIMALCVFLLDLNLNRRPEEKLLKRLSRNLAWMFPAWLLFVATSLLVNVHYDCFTGLLLFQFAIASITCTIIGHLHTLYKEKERQKEEIAQLKIENLQSRYDALLGQVNPHFFFNSLNGLASLVRQDDKEVTLEYIMRLSDVFRYILQSDKKRLGLLRDELNFIRSFIYLQKVRYADNFNCTIDIPEEKQECLLPVLSLLPLLENVVKHNMIDSENPMNVVIRMNAGDELVITNPIHEKIEPPESNKIGLKNLSSRFELLLGKKIRISTENRIFSVTLPLNNQPHESLNRRR